MKLSLITATHRRSHFLRSRALPSVLNQSDCEFEWIVINDGRDIATRELIEPFKTVIYREIDHSDRGFGLCIARNLGLSIATGEIVSYLDDDNAIAPQFVAEIKAFFHQNSQIRCCMVQQHRRRNIIQNDQLIKQGKPFISPAANSTVRD
ncbi:glycosyltransferase family 2 protein, partial [Pseudanabaenaceae cyanobacterium LEGE 13415]|nr:glycosyltransferase family 2 protein [Pseudanabaenaceae cyanobacterium LEGE 13415]